MRTIDSHTHCELRCPAALLSQMDRYQYDRLCVLALPDCGDVLNNLHTMEVKHERPERVFAYGGMQYFPTLEPSGKSHLQQLKMMMDAGFDGWKIIESKPTQYVRNNIPLDSDVFDSAFAHAEEAGILIKWHCGDPATFWDPERAPDWAIREGWLYGENHPTLQELYRQTEAVLARHPKLNVTLAHFYFTSDDMDHARRMMDNFENLRFDLCPGSEMFHAFVRAPEKWHDFFVEYQDRLIFGTDRIDDMGDEQHGTYDGWFDYFQRTLFQDKELNENDTVGRGLALPAELGDKIFWKNFVDIAGADPKPIHRKNLEAFANWLLPHVPASDRAEWERLTAKLCSE